MMPMKAQQLASKEIEIHQLQGNKFGSMTYPVTPLKNNNNSQTESIMNNYPRKVDLMDPEKVPCKSTF